MTAQKEILRELVFEIGTEELPATNLADIFESAASGAENTLLAKWKRIFQDNRISFGRADLWATPRRLVFYLDGVGSAQEKRDQLTRVMTKQEAYGADGQPTEKFLTILKHRNADIRDTVIQDAAGKDTVFIKKAEPVRKTASVLPELLETFVKTLAFPKNMKWDASGVYFPRPIRHSLCFYGSDAIKFKIGQTRSSDRVWIFSKGKRAAYPAKDPASYFKTLKKHSVILDPAERKKSIQTILDRMAKQHGAKLYEDPFLLNEVNFLVENPQGLAAPFHEDFLKLPLEVLTVSMARKQRIFGLVDAHNKVEPRFLAILDGAVTEKDKKVISRNFENILHAKLQDSLFFYKEDVKQPLERKHEELKNLIFLKGAGSMLQKSERLERMARALGPAAGFADQEVKDLCRAAQLSKCDLLTQMVGEFPELQGIMGKYYAREAGERDAVALAVGEQYLPRTVSDVLPSSKLGAALSALDKLDLVCACFALGLEPTSSLDPYALRRSASAVFKILVHRNIRANISHLVSQNLDLLKPQIQGFDAQAVEKKIRAFFQDRFRAVLVDLGLRSDIVESVLASGFDDVHKAHARASALSQSGSQNDLLRAAKVIERTANILKGNKEPLSQAPDPAVFTESLERDLMAKFQEHRPSIDRAKTEGDFALATSLYAEAFFDILNEFFDKVFINAEDMVVRKNRLSLLKAIKELYTGDIADLSKIQIHPGSTRSR